MNILQEIFEFLAFCCWSRASAQSSGGSSFAQSSIRINNTKYKLLKLLGEGGFSYVYLCSDAEGRLYALKKIRCAFGEESLQTAMREVQAYAMFHDRHLMKCFDHAVLQEKNCRIVYILMPYYKKGNLQDEINANIVQESIIGEQRIITLMMGVCQALRAMHERSDPGNLGLEPNASGNLDLTTDEDQTPFLRDTQADMVNDLAIDANLYACKSFAHYDIKPANIMLTDDDEPVLMDFGSVKAAQIQVSSRSQALQLQDEAAEHSTMSYRAPELFDVRTNGQLDEKVDIWSLGCTLYTMLFLHSPFETQNNEQGSLALAITSGQFDIPTAHIYSPGLIEIVRACLQVKPSDRPRIDEVLKSLESLSKS